MLETLFLSLNYEKSECINLKNCALGGSIILSTGGSIFVSAEAKGSSPSSEREADLDYGCGSR